MTKQGKKVLGIIAEYNPLHNGHLYHLKEAKRRSGCDYVIVVLSGNFVQRGAPALLDKYTRARFALLAGADLVLELPVCFAAGSAEFFAKGAVALLDRLGIVDFLGFGCESDSLTELSALAAFLAEEPEEYRLALAGGLRSGSNFPTARQAAAALFLPEETAALLSSPNNILAVEYLKALQIFSSSIRPVAIRREGGGYHDTSFGSSYASATAIRAALRAGLPDEAEDALPEQVPSYVALYLTGPHFRPVWEEHFSDLLFYRLQSLKHSELTAFQDVSDALADRIRAFRHEPLELPVFADRLLTRSYTAARIRRALFHILLSVTSEEMEQAAVLGFAPYARILALKKESGHILREPSESGRIPLITKVADAKHILSAKALPFLEQDIAAAELYNQIVHSRYGLRIESDYFHKLPIL